MDTKHESIVSHETTHRPGKTSLIAGVEVREADLQPQHGLHLSSIVIRICSVITFLLALWQFVAWWLDPPAGGVGVGVLVGDTVRLVVLAALLWAVSALADLMVKTHYDVRAGRVLLARQTHILQQMGNSTGAVPKEEPNGHRRAVDAAASGNVKHSVGR
ncbi:MAG: hypothetical protein WEE89_20700 [Gemmatimonadota bacterium]